MTNRLRVRIKPGAAVSQDFGFGKWPATKSGQDVDVNMIFDAVWDGRFWDCRADGFGARRWEGEAGEYGNGSITVIGMGGVEIANEGDEQ